MITIKQLKKLSEFSLRKLAKVSGMNYSTLSYKLREESELKVNESQLLEKVLRDEFNIKLIELDEYGREK